MFLPGDYKLSCNFAPDCEGSVIEILHPTTGAVARRCFPVGSKSYFGLFRVNHAHRAIMFRFPDGLPETISLVNPNGGPNYYHYFRLDNKNHKPEVIYRVAAVTREEFETLEKEAC